MMNCKEWARLKASDELQCAGWLCRLSFWLHRWMCPPCRQYGEDLEGLGHEAREMLREKESCTQALRDRIVSRCVHGVEQTRSEPSE